MTTSDLRKLYLDFFVSKDHQLVPSDSLVPKDDPSLLFTGAGMNQFKEQFLGRNITYSRAASSQKCLRTGDLENVGRTPRHHTFFEMLGNFSFGDYFKKEAVEWAWEFMTKKLGIPSHRLWASVYKDDDEAYDIWKNIIKLPEHKIIKFGEKDNFWPSEAPSKGPNGPCGPCSEIFYDYGEDVGCRKKDCTPACDCGRFVEVWNLVFTQYDRRQDGTLKPLPSRNIDTGMGLERLASVMQGVRTNFEIDIFIPIIQEIKKKPGVKPDTEKLAVSKVNAIADHIRAVVFAISDGAMPSNEERGYVVRKLIRRSMTHARDLDIKGPFLFRLVSIVVDVMKDQYPELLSRREEIAQIVKKEEESFQVVIDTQLPKVDEAFEKIKREDCIAKLPEIAFNFYDTYGMPYDMLEELAEKHGLKIDDKAFGKLLEAQRQKSRSKSKIKGEIFTETFAKKVEALGLGTEFLGYATDSSEATVLAVLDGGEVILDRTPFYGESGGQCGDEGIIETPSGAMEVHDAKKIGNSIVHIGKLIRGSIKKGDHVKVSIDTVKRKATMANHTATHILQAALRKVLGDHVHQTGSMVDEEHLRFDFTHIKKLEERELKHVEELVNESIKSAIPVSKDIRDIETARTEGATALFGEKYDKMVRVVTIGDISKELCGGTHVDNTKAIGLFKIMSESSVASGVRRIEAVTGRLADEWMVNKKKEEDARIESERKKEESKKLAAGRINDEVKKLDLYIGRGKNVNRTLLIADVVDDIGIEGLRVLSDKIKERSASAIVILASKSSDKVSFVVAVTDDMAQKGFNAGAICKNLAAIVDGSGGGKQGFAQGGGRSPGKTDGALKDIIKDLEIKLSG